MPTDPLPQSLAAPPSKLPSDKNSTPENRTAASAWRTVASNGRFQEPRPSTLGRLPSVSRATSPSACSVDRPPRLRPSENFVAMTGSRLKAVVQVFRASSRSRPDAVIGPHIHRMTVPDHSAGIRSASKRSSPSGRTSIAESPDESPCAPARGDAERHPGRGRSPGSTKNGKSPSSAGGLEKFDISGSPSGNFKP